jgi:hypothetical protein
MATTVATIETRIQRFVADSLGDWATAANLDPFIFTAYRDVQRLLRAAGVTMFRRTSAPIVLAAGVTRIERTAGVSPVSPTAYPSDLVRPVEVAERINPAGGTTLTRMSQSAGIMEDRALTALMQEWDWKYDAIVFPGATGDVAVVIEYEAALADLTSGSSTLLITDGDDAVTYLAAARALRSRGGQDDLAATLETAAQQSIAAIVASELSAKASMKGRWGTQDQGEPGSVQSVLRFAGPLVNDNLPQGQQPLGDADLVPYVRAAYRDIARRLRAEGLAVFHRTSAPIEILAGVKLLGRTGGTTNLPADFIRPLEVMERVSGTGTYTRMSQSEGLFEDRAATDLMQEWEWKDDALRFVGASGAVEIIIEYEAALPELLSPSDLLLIPDSHDTVAYLAASYALSTRSGVDSSKLDAKAKDAVSALVASELRLKQAMGGRWGPQDQAAFDTVQSVLRVCSGLVNERRDVPALSDAALMTHVRAAYADIIQMLRIQRTMYLVKTVVILNVTNTNTSLGPDTTPALPADFIRPLYVREQHTVQGGMTANGWSHMEPISLSGIGTTNARTQQPGDTYRGYYRWSNGELLFPATGVFEGNPVHTDIELTYEFEPGPLLTPQTRIAVPGAGTAIAVQAAAYAVIARGQDATALQGRADRLVAMLVDADKISRETATGQFGPRNAPE